MIISHEHKFIFIKTAKTAGTSIEIALSRHCGADDVITPISNEDEETRQRLGYRGPQNCYAPAKAYGARDLARLLIKRRRKLHFYNHISAKEIRRRLGMQTWNEYYKFCFERNPFDRVISHYYWCNKSEPRPPISNFIKSKNVLSLKHQGYDLYTIDGEMAVDKVCRFENISEELEAMRIRVGIPERLELPHAKSTQRTDRRSYRDILNEQDRAQISRLFCDELDLLGYQF